MEYNNSNINKIIIKNNKITIVKKKNNNNNNNNNDINESADGSFCANIINKR